jgi:hypothetical protein
MRARNLLILGAAALSLLAGSAPAQAGASSPGRHCVVWISPATNGGHSPLSPLHCFTTQATANRFATGPAPSRFQTTTGQIATASTRISIDYDSSGFTGTTLTWTVANSAGCNGYNYSAASMPSGWNDRVSSSHSYNGCANNDHYHDTNFLGAGIVCTCSTMGTMNNQTSSETWTA